MVPEIEECENCHDEHEDAQRPDGNPPLVGEGSRIWNLTVLGRGGGNCLRVGLLSSVVGVSRPRPRQRSEDDHPCENEPAGLAQVDRGSRHRRLLKRVKVDSACGASCTKRKQARRTLEVARR